MAKNTTSVRLPEALIEALDRKALAHGVTRSELIIQAVERALDADSSWSPDFLSAIGTRRPELDDTAAAMMSAIRGARSRSRPPTL